VGRGGLFVDFAQVHIELLTNFVADAPRCFRRRDRMPLQPAAIGVLKEIDRRTDGGVEIGGEEITGSWSGCGRIVGSYGGCAARGKDSGGSRSKDAFHDFACGGGVGEIQGAMQLTQ